MGLIGSNPRLTRLEVSFQYNEIYNHLRPALESLSQLKYVKLEELFLGRQENLSPFLNNNPDLQDLRLNDPTGISGFSGCRPLKNLTRFEIDDVIWEENPGLQHFFHLCPNLIALNLVHRGGSAPFVRELCGILREHCPKLDWIRYRNSHSRVHGAVQAEDIVAWTQASSRLVHFDTLALTFATSIYQALMCHSVWIDTLCLKFLRGAEENVRNTSKILEHCTNLRSLKVIHASTVSDLKLEWFEEPWRTDKLESLCLQGFTVPLKRVKSIQDDSFDEMLTERHRPRIVAGKKVFRDLSQGWTPVTYEHLTRMITESAWAFRDMVFERVQYAPRLYRLTVECFGLAKA
ncbi:hypothetical protein BG005_008970 [Podila minutissima]|nr:hypothetical protein BG005_008970 [Podila minutissima]